jgi:hypothetical protein
MDGKSFWFAVLVRRSPCLFFENLISYGGDLVNNYQIERKDLARPEASFLIDVTAF